MYDVKDSNEIKLLEVCDRDTHEVKTSYLGVEGIMDGIAGTVLIFTKDINYCVKLSDGEMLKIYKELPERH